MRRSCWRKLISMVGWWAAPHSRRLIFYQSFPLSVDRFELLHIYEYSMNFFLTSLLAVQMLAAVAMIGLILVQHGKGADMGAAFGSGSSGSLFGASGSANFLSRATAVLATLFFACTLL